MATSESDDEMENWLDSERPYRGRIFDLRVGQVTLDNGAEAQREVVEHPGGVCIVPVLGDSVVLIRQYRIAVAQTILELPAGKLEGDEEPSHRGHCELEEETGYRAGRLVDAGSILPSAGYTSERIYLFLAFDLEEVGQKLEFDEAIEVVTIPIEKLRGMLAALEIDDAKTIVGLHRLFDYMART